MDNTEPPIFLAKKAKLQQETNSPDVMMDDTRAESPSTTHVQTDSTRLSSHVTPMYTSHFKEMNVSNPNDTLIKEAACGITEFVNPHLPGFKGFLKKRYTDFLVNEILPSGLVVHLTSLKVTKAPKGQNLDHPAHPAKDLSRFESISAQQNPAPIISPSEDDKISKEAPRSPTPKPIATPSSSIKSTSPSNASEIDAKALVETSEDDVLSVESKALSSADELKPLAPHLRKVPISRSVPRSMQELDGSEPPSLPEQKKRKKQTVTIRQIAEGWVEVDDANEKATKEQNATGTTIDKLESKSKPAENSVIQDPMIVDSKIMAPPPVPSTQSQWQAFAGPPTTGFQLNKEDRNTLVNYFGSETVDSIINLYERIVNSSYRKSKDYGSVTSGQIGRDVRSRIHQDIRRIFNSRLETRTDGDGALVITAMAETPVFHARTPISNTRGNDRRNGGRIDRSKRPSQWNKPNWEDLGGDHLHFSLFKENRDTMELICLLARELKMKPSLFQFAGTKDRRGVTVQRISIYRVLIERLIGAGRSLRQAKIGNFEYQQHQLQLGELSGNEFVITLRDCDFQWPMSMDSKAMIEAAESVVGMGIKNLVEKGFVNYYGLQRFGSFSTGTDDIGVKMLQGDFRGAVDGILHFSPAALAAAQDPMNDNDNISYDDKARAHAIHAFKTTGKGSSALEKMPRKFSAESNIVRYLSSNNNSKDYLGAVQTIQRNLRLMYVHAYQSLVWNMAASERWKRFGDQVVEGDLVLIDEHTAKTNPATKPEDVDVDGEAVIHPAEDDRAADPEDKFIRARALTKEEAKSDSYTIFDIVLPTPGYDILYPANSMLKFYEDFMASERGGGLNPHDMRRKWKDVSLSGSYRKLLARPLNDMTAEVKIYKTPDEQFVETDLDRINNAKQEIINAQHTNSAPLSPISVDNPPAGPLDTPTSTTSPSKDPKPNVHRKPPSSVLSDDTEPGGVSLSGGPYRDFKIAVVLKMQLGTSQYATMALRELMKEGGCIVYKPDFGGGR